MPFVSTLMDQPLPAELTGRAQGWFTQYRRYPVFSPPWVRGRLRIVGVTIALFVLLVAPLLFTGDPLQRPWPGVTTLLVSLLVPALAGPWAGCWVRRRGWLPPLEGAALVALIGAVVLAMSAFYVRGEEPFKDVVARAAGQVDTHGRRTRVAMTIGIAVSSPGDAGAPMKPVVDARDDPALFGVNLGVRAVLAFILAGGLALRGWRRERDGLAALARERELADAQARRREAELRLSVLAAQVEPHFLFNTLAGVRSAIATDPARASEMIDRLVEYLRATIPRLRGEQSAQATVGAQFDTVRAYLGLMAARMPRLHYTVTAPAALASARCPPLMLISLAENAVKHGVERKIGPAHVEVRAEAPGDGRLLLSVEDDGAGFGDTAAGSGLGLQNIRERLAQLYGERGTLALKARPQGGVAATISVPLEPAT